jgi:hypothetical protein
MYLAWRAYCLGEGGVRWDVCSTLPILLPIIKQIVLFGKLNAASNLYMFGGEEEMGFDQLWPF